MKSKKKFFSQYSAAPASSTFYGIEQQFTPIEGTVQLSDEYSSAKRRTLLDPSFLDTTSVKRSLLETNEQDAANDGNFSFTSIFHSGNNGGANKISKKMKKSLQLATPSDQFLHNLSSNGSVAQQLRSLIGTHCKTSEEKYILLKKRDELMYKARVKNTDVSVVNIVNAVCPDMCSEKERYMRETQRNLNRFECDNLGKMMPVLMVKDYSRSAADQEEPLPHELRPPHVLQMTMSYLINNIARKIPPDVPDLIKWYDFLWSRTRSIRKEISQQMLCDRVAVDLVEKCVRLHVFASFWMANLNICEFNQKMNSENLSKSLQTLRHMYDDLAEEGQFCANEAEFRSYDMMLNLSDANVFRHVCSYREEVRKAGEIQLTLSLASSLQNNNYVRFFRCLKSETNFLQACICHRYLSVARYHAMEIISSAYKLFPIDNFTEMLAFDGCEHAKAFLSLFGLSIEDGDMDVSAGKRSFRSDANTPSPESLPVGRCMWIIQKINKPSLAEVLCNGPCVPVLIPPPINSFDAAGRYTRDPFNYADVMPHFTPINRNMPMSVPAMQFHPSTMPYNLSPMMPVQLYGHQNVQRQN